ncbi:hypothetical protein BUALT_Bualt06G0130400 [Buddleja alternifolia]|uniref:SHSP domain-containing protein n=1 Tax=Buddleja alternifolia TaxID=168488 RepID=A0AAV6XEG8_9LAMI|nr:hypothetical protein BUALT_Bualt06G0130400 [Buddleja alternifolia]
MDKFMDSPVTSALRRSWDAKDTVDGLHLRMDVPGLGKVDVKVTVEQNTLIIKGEGKKEFEDDESGRRYTSRIDLPEKLYKTNEIKAEMKNGVPKMFLPKIKEVERSRVNVGVADVFYPFSTRSSLSQILNMMDQFMESPVTSALRRNWEAKETADGLHLRMDMPGLSKEEVKVSVEQNTLIIKGEDKKEFEDDESGRRYTSRIDLPERLYKTNEIKAEMKNGVLKVFLPKIKEEERSDVFHVNVE